VIDSQITNQRKHEKSWAIGQVVELEGLMKTLVNLRSNQSRESEFNQWLKQFFTRLYLSPRQISDYSGPFPIGNRWLKQKNKFEQPMSVPKDKLQSNKKQNCNL
jgi:hypothetical protein